jgi:hypothetical protein
MWLAGTGLYDFGWPPPLLAGVFIAAPIEWRARSEPT